MSKKISENDQSVLHLITNPGLPIDEAKRPLAIDEDSTFDVDHLRKVKELERNAVRLADEKDYEAAMECLKEALSVLPDRASVYNNRAQLWRLMSDDEAAMCDLDKAIELSGGQGKTASFAFTQRALILKMRGEKKKALEDFKKAADLGNLFAKKEVVDSNPYAALCNQMLAKAFKDLSGGPATGVDVSTSLNGENECCPSV